MCLVISVNMLYLKPSPQHKHSGFHILVVNMVQLKLQIALPY